MKSNYKICRKLYHSCGSALTYVKIITSPVKICRCIVGVLGQFRLTLYTTKSMSADSADVFGEDNSWRGVPISELYGSQSPWSAPEFPLVVPAHNHTVLYHIPSHGITGDRPPKPQIGHDKWDQEHVRLPCSRHSLYPVKDANGESHLKKRWEIIESALWRPIRDSHELADVILSYNTKFKNIWRFQALHKLFDDYLEEEETQYFFDVTLPEIAKLALALPKLVQTPIPLLRQHKNQSVSMSQQQIASLLANAFFCTFPRRNSTKSTSEYATYPFINFNRLFETSGSSHVLEKLKCICHYFRRVCTKAGGGAVTFSRRGVAPRGLPAWPASRAPLPALPLHLDPGGTIEGAHGLIQVDFANKYLGGGVLNHGCVQEEIRFVICPELLVSMLFTEYMRPNEAVLIIGCERYSNYSGYGHTFQWAGDCRDATPRDSSQRRRTAVLAIDAAPSAGRAHELHADTVRRDLNKAWVGFSFLTDPQSTCLQYPGVATGNWGCGAFGGSYQLKSLLQMMACAQARRPMAYYTFNDLKIRDDVIEMYNLLVRHNVTVGLLYRYILKYSQTEARRSDLKAYLINVLTLTEAKSKPTQDSISNDHIEVMETSADSSLQENTAQTSGQQTIVTKDSPDLFSQDEMDESLIEIKIENDADGASKLKANAETPATSKLIDEMKRSDQESGRSDQTVPYTSPFKQASNRSLNNTLPSMGDAKTTPSVSSVEKKKINKKITDYYTKKSI